VDYSKGIFALSTPPSASDWGMQTEEEWKKLTDTLRSVGELESDKPLSDYYTNDFVAK
jgi:NitT/TauT family transport system substrate-binding protein